MKFAKALMDLLFAPQANCMGCGDVAGCDHDWLCDECFAALDPLCARERSRANLCAHCGEPVAGYACARCKTRAVNLLPACAAYAYAPPVDAMVRSFKFHSVYRMGEWMGAQMALAYRASNMPPADLIVPVPMHKARENKRGFNQSEKLAIALAANLNLPVIKALIRRKNTRQQARLAGEARRANLSNAFAARLPLDGKRVLLVDDVRTTGTTVTACARVLFEAGAKGVSVCTFARVE